MQRDKFEPKNTYLIQLWRQAKPTDEDSVFKEAAYRIIEAGLRDESFIIRRGGGGALVYFSYNTYNFYDPPSLTRFFRPHPHPPTLDRSRKGLCHPSFSHPFTHIPYYLFCLTPPSNLRVQNKKSIFSFLLVNYLYTNPFKNFLTHAQP